jgi:hypothetical protein
MRKAIVYLHFKSHGPLNVNDKVMNLKKKTVKTVFF